MTELTPWLASTRTALDNATTLSGIEELMQTSEVTRALECDDVKLATDAVTASVGSEPESVLFGIPTLVDGSWHRQVPRIIVLTGQAIYRVEVSAVDGVKAATVSARVPLASVASVEGATFGFALNTTDPDPEYGEGTFTNLFYEYIKTPPDNRYEMVHWLDVDTYSLGAPPAALIPLSCSAIRAATRIAISGSAGAEERVRMLSGAKRWEGGLGAAKEEQAGEAA